jgi:hypothetical protein
MASPFRRYRTFIDANGVRWGVEARLMGEGTDAVPVGFVFVSQRDEHRALDGSMPDCLAWEQFCDSEWRQLLIASRLVLAPAVRHPRPRYPFTPRAGRP